MLRIDLAYESGALKGAITPVQYWALGFLLATKRREEREEREEELKYNTFLQSPDLYQELYGKREEADESSDIMTDEDFDSAEELLRQLDTQGSVTISGRNLGEWI